MFRISTAVVLLYLGLATSVMGQADNQAKKGHCDLGNLGGEITRKCQTDDHCVFQAGCYAENGDGERLGDCTNGVCECICLEGPCEGRRCSEQYPTDCPAPVQEPCSCRLGPSECRGVCENDRSVECHDDAQCVFARVGGACDLSESTDSAGIELLCVNETMTFSCVPKADLEINQDCEIKNYFLTSRAECAITVRNLSPDRAAGNRVFFFEHLPMAGDGGFFLIEDIEPNGAVTFEMAFGGDWIIGVESETNDPDLSNNTVTGDVPTPFGFGVQGLSGTLLDNDDGFEWAGAEISLRYRVFRRVDLEVALAHLDGDDAFRDSLQETDRHAHLNGDLDVVRLSTRIQLGRERRIWGLDLGAGIYDFNSASQSEGLSLGINVVVFRAGHSSVEASARVHHLIDGAAEDREFVTVGLGLNLGR